MKTACRVVVLLSGRGSNFVNLVTHAVDYEVVGVVTNRADAGGITAAQERSIDTRVCLREKKQPRALYHELLAEVVRSFSPDLVVLAGFMEILQPSFLDAFPNRIINIHPSLLPALPGLHTHERALKHGHTEHGCTVHLVDAGMDTGPLIAQAPCSVAATDTPEELAARVLKREHELYPWVVGHIARGAITLDEGVISVGDTVRAEAVKKNFLLASA